MSEQGTMTVSVTLGPKAAAALRAACAASGLSLGEAVAAAVAAWEPKPAKAAAKPAKPAGEAA